MVEVVFMVFRKVLRIRFRSRQQLFLLSKAWEGENIVDHPYIS
jgi:hypothetical protein